MATKATTKKVAPKKVAAKKAVKFIPPALKFSGKGDENILTELGMTEARAQELEDKTGKIYEDADSYGIAFEQAAALAEDANELYFIIFTIGAIACVEKYHNSRPDPLEILLPLLAGASVRPLGRPARTNVQGRRKDGNGKR